MTTEVKICSISCVRRYVARAEERRKTHEERKDELEIEIVELECQIMDNDENGLDSYQERCFLDLKYAELRNVERTIAHLNESIDSLK